MAAHDAETATGPSNDQRFVFADFEVDLQRGNLARGGEEIALRPKSFAMLLYLLEHAGELVPREDLLDAVWPEVVVTDGSIAQCLIELRRALGDDTRSMIRTVPRRGLIFDVPVHVEDTPATPMSQNRPDTVALEGPGRDHLTSRWRTAGIALAMVLLLAGSSGLFLLTRPAPVERESAAASVEILPNSVAVLPFENTGLDPNDSYLSDGLSDELRAQLGRIEEIRVAARSSSQVAVQRQLSALEASEQLMVANLVEGSIRRDGGLLRITVQLIEGRTGLALWSKSFERGRDELVLVQQEIAEAVISRVIPDSSKWSTEPATWDPTANELVMLAHSYEERVRARTDVDVDLLLKAVQLYRQATEADPNSALVHSYLAGALLYLGDLDAAEVSVQRATAIDPNLAEVQNTLGELYWARGQPEAGDAWKRAVELNPKDPDALSNFAQWRWTRMHIDGVKELFERALELDPLNLERYASLGFFLASEDFNAEAREIIARVQSRFEDAAAWRVIADLNAHLGDVDRSIAWTLRAHELEPHVDSHIERLAEYFADIGDFETALHLDPGGIGILFKMRRFDQVIDQGENLMLDYPEDLWLRSLLAISYNAIGNYESALYVLSSTGLSESVIRVWRSSAEWAGLLAMMNAQEALGETEAARELAQWAVDYGLTPSLDWESTLTWACQVALLGRDDEVRDYLRRARRSSRLAWDPWLKDLPCFERFAGDPTYQATVDYFEARRAALRERLLQTLVEFGVVSSLDALLTKDSVSAKVNSESPPSN